MCAAGRRYNNALLEDEDSDWYSDHLVKVQSKKNKNKKKKKSKKIKNEIRAKRQTGTNISGQPINFTDLAPFFDEEECVIDDLDETVPTQSVLDSKKKKTTKKKKKVPDKVKLLKTKVRKTRQPASGSNIDVGFDESCSAQQSVVNCPKGINIDVHLPACIRLEQHLQGEDERSERSDECVRMKESMEVQMLPSQLSVQLSIRCDMDAAGGENDEDGNDAVTTSEVRSPSDVAWTSTVNRVGTGRNTLRSATPKLQSSVGNTPAAEISHHQTSKFNHTDTDCHSAVPTCSDADGPEPCQGNSDTATNLRDQELRRNDEYRQSSCSVDLSEVCRVLRELNIKLEHHVGANVQSKPNKENTRDNAVEDGVKQLKSLISSNAVNAARISEASKIDGLASNRVNSASREPELLRTCQEVSNSYLSACKPSHTEHHHDASPTDTSCPSSLQFVPSDFQRDRMSNLQELVYQLTHKANEAEYRVNRLERDVLIMSRTGNQQPSNDQDQDQTGTLPAITGGNSDASCSLQYGWERTRSRSVGIRDDRTTDAGETSETETGQFWFDLYQTFLFLLYIVSVLSIITYLCCTMSECRKSISVRVVLVASDQASRQGGVIGG